MTQGRPALRWWILAPLCLGAGLVAGRWLPRGSQATSWPLAPEAASPAVAGVPSFAPIVERARGAVVGVRAVVDKNATPGGGKVEDDVPDTRTAIQGTGFLIDPRGLVVTNHHLVAGCKLLRVAIPGYRVREAEVVGEDAVTDIAVLRIKDAPADLPCLRLGDSHRLRQGDWVVTVGNPYEFRMSVAAGIVSYVARHLSHGRTGVTRAYLQFSAPAHPGSSGAPVLDLEGNVVGVTTLAVPGGQGITFAVPSRVLQWVLDSFERHGGRVRRGFLGIEFGQNAQGDTVGALVGDVREGSPAAAAGLRPGDVITRFDGREVVDALELHDWITCATPGSEVRLHVLRNGQGSEVSGVKIGEVGDPARPAKD